MSRIEQIVTLQAAAGKGGALRETLATLAAATRTEPGSIVYDIYEAPGERFYVIEVWRDAEALEAHISAPHTMAVIGEFGALLAGAHAIESCAAVSVAALEGAA